MGVGYSRILTFLAFPSLPCDQRNPTRTIFSISKKTFCGPSLPTWLMHPGPVLVRNFTRGSKHDDLVQQAELTHARRRLKGIHSRSDTNRTGAEGLSFYYPRLLHCLDQMLAVMSLSQHRVSSSKTVRPRAPCGARCIGHAVSTWSAVCSEAPHSRFGEGARPHLCMGRMKTPNTQSAGG